MVSRGHLLFCLLILTQTRAAPLLDPIDECILTCDDCFKGQSLLECANDCIYTFGDVSDKWRITCSQFEDLLPLVVQVK
ncbi:hypothetical protein ABEB36_002232 [Hypothenemus hampei]|uniref:Uncharacterized protein n=1 Tax=Hypothenemus hampei TaxID=57062 RepID=A0ABD1F506_HYPHA